MQLLSFHNDPAVKEKYLTRLRQHAAADDIVQGAAGRGGKGCAVWCTLDKYEHASYETELGIPRIIASLEDRIFERLTVGESKAFCIKFLSVIPVGKDLVPVWKKFLVWLLVDPADGVLKYAKTERASTAIKDVAALIEESLTRTVGSGEFLKVRNAAAAAAAAAYAAAADAADAAAAAAYAAAAYDAAAAAYDAAAYAAAGVAADGVAADARRSAWTRIAAKLIELLSAA